MDWGEDMMSNLWVLREADKPVEWTGSSTNMLVCARANMVKSAMTTHLVLNMEPPLRRAADANENTAGDLTRYPGTTLRSLRLQGTARVNRVA